MIAPMIRALLSTGLSVSLAAATFAVPAVANAQMCTPQSTGGATPIQGGETFSPANNGGSSSFLGSSRASAPAPKYGTPKNLRLEGPTQSLHILTGPASPDRTDHWGITSTDLGIAYLDKGSNQTYLAFGDTGGCRAPGDDFWRSNALVRTQDSNFGDGLDLQEVLTDSGYRSSGTAKEFLRSLHAPNDAYTEVTKIPTAGIVVDGVHYMDYMSVRHWGAPGQWDTNYAATARSIDGVNWDVVPGTVRENAGAAGGIGMPDSAGQRPGNDKLQMSAFYEEDGYIYRMSTGQGRYGAAYLSRAPKAQFPREDAFEYFDGTGWSRNAGALAPVIDDRVSELSVTYSTYLGKYVALYLVEGTGLVMRTADSLTGPWSPRRVLVDKDTIPDIYGGFIMPKQDDQHLYYVATTWSDYNVYFLRTNLDFVGVNTEFDDNITVADITGIPGN